MGKLKLDAINYLGECRRGEDKIPTSGLVVASFELGKTSFETYLSFAEELRLFILHYNDKYNAEFGSVQKHHKGD